MLSRAVIEIRQHLCCANVFLQLDESLPDSEDLQIQVEKQLIRIINSETELVTELHVAPYFGIVEDSFSNLVADARNVSFRISVLDVQGLEVNEQTQYKIDLLQLNENEEASLHCSQCVSMLCAARKYEKIREFPSGSIDVGDFFCHHGPSFHDVLQPRSQDLFYGHECLILNIENMLPNLKTKVEHVYCNHCQKYLGETLFNGKAVKLWADSVKFKRKTDDEPIEIFQRGKENPCSDLLLKVINESALPSPEPLLRNMHFIKAVLETTLPNCQRQYLLIHILEKHLPVLRTPNDKALDCSQVSLKVANAFKMLYRLFSNEKDANALDKDDIKEPAILSYWLQDINILKMKISPFVFRQLVENLELNSRIFPKIYSHNKDQFIMSYIFQ